MLPEGERSSPSDTAGLVWDFAGRQWGLSSIAVRYPDFVRFLNRYLQQTMPADHYSCFRYSCITTNIDFACRRHRDAGNSGPTAITTCGTYTGGALLYWPDDNGSNTYGQLLRDFADEICTRKRIAIFDGNRAHEVMPFKGKRYSIVFFLTNSCWKSARVGEN